jgi:hypothetical protein
MYWDVLEKLTEAAGMNKAATILSTLRQWPRPTLTAVLAAILALSAIPVKADAQSIPPSARLSGVTHHYQTWNNCGGANLTMALSYFGWGYDQEVARRWLKPDIEDKNVSPWEMTDFVNKVQTALPNVRAIWRFGGDLDLIKRLVAGGFPVIVESGFDVADLGWMGHYETVVAYDDPSQTIWVFDSYLGVADGWGRTYSYTEFDYWWRHFNRTFIVLFTLDRQADLWAALGDHGDPQKATNIALSTARQEATANRGDPWAWFAMGMSYARLGNFHDAATAFDQAFALGMPFRMTWYVFSPFEAYWNVGRFNDVIALADNTLATTIHVEELYYWRGMALAALGQHGLALNEFNKALSFNPNFTEAADMRAQVEAGTFWAPAPV